VVVQDVVVGEVLASYVESISRRPLVVVVLAPRADVVSEREAARAKTAYREDMSGITAMDEGLRGATPRIGLWLDTSEQTPDETVDEIVRRGLAEGSVG
jgi:hypothetical protein